jgi:hypothetical protein
VHFGESHGSCSSVEDNDNEDLSAEKMRERDLKRDLGEVGEGNGLEGGVSCVCTESFGLDLRVGKRITFWWNVPLVSSVL